MGNPTDLREGDRDMRFVVRNLIISNKLVSVLARGQGQLDLRDINGVFISAPRVTAVSLSKREENKRLVTLHGGVRPPSPQ